MAWDLSAFIDEIRTVIGTVWPEVPSASICTSLQATKTQIVEAIRDGRYVVPGVVIGVGDSSPDPDWGLGNDTQRLPVSIFYISVLGAAAGDKTTLTQAAMNTQIRLLRTAIDAPGTAYTTFQAIERGAVETSEMSPENNQLIKEDKTSIYTGCVSWQPGFLIVE